MTLISNTLTKYTDTDASRSLGRHTRKKLVLATSPHGLQNLVPRTVHMKRFEKQVARILRENTKGSAHTRALVPVCSLMKSLHEGIGRRDLSQEQFTPSVLRGQVPNFVAKIASSHDGTCPRDLLQGPVPLCVSTFMS